jgi:hypothetical protein
VAHARLVLEAVKFSSAISGQQMVVSGRSEGEDLRPLMADEGESSV